VPLFSRKINVTMIDDRTDAVLAVTKLLPDDLPEAFFASTTLHLASGDWSVTSADPMTRVEYTKSGRLVLRLHPIENLDPRELLFTLPTICDALPASQGPMADGTELVMLEDDWRQCEFVSEAFLDDVEEEFAAVRRIVETERAGLGFRKVHARSLVPLPLGEGSVSPADLRTLLGERPQRRLRFDGAGRCVSGGFAFALEADRLLYGMLSGDSVAFIGLTPARQPGLAGLRAFAAGAHLVLVDWCRCVVAHPNDASFDAFRNDESR